MPQGSLSPHYSTCQNQNELKSIKTLVELMESQLAFISTSSEATLESATALDIQISEFTNQNINQDIAKCKCINIHMISICVIHTNPVVYKILLM